MAVQLPAGPLSGPTQHRNRRRNPFWRFRRFLFVLAVVAGVAAGATWAFVSQVELEEDNFDDLIETTYICTGEVAQNCGPENSANELAIEGQDRVVVDYADMPEVLLQAVVATEDKSFFAHRGVDPGGLLRAAYQVGKQQLTSDGGSFQGGSTITQQYIKLATSDDQVDLSRKAREIVRAIKLEQELSESLGSKEAAKEQIIERYLNRAYFGRGVYGVQAASRIYFDKDVENLALPEAAYLAGLLKNPSTGDATEDPVEADRRRNITLGQMVEQEYITVEQQLEAQADSWPDLIPPPEAEVGIGEVAGSEIGTEYFISAVRRQLNQIYPEGEFYTQSLRVYTTLDPQLQRLAYRTITGKLDPRNEFMPLGSLVAVNDNGEVLAMMGGADWDSSQVNLATGTAGGGSGFQAGSTMKTFALAEFIEQGFSPESYYEAPFTIEYPQDAEGKCARWKVRGGVTNNKAKANHRTVYQATAGSMNTVFAQLITQIGAPQVKDMANRLGVESDMLDCPSLVLGPNAVSPLEMAGAYANIAREGVRLDPVIIERIEDADGNVLCWYPVDSCSPQNGSVRRGEQVIEASVARQVTGALAGVVSGGTGRAARLIDPETETTRPAAGKTGTTQNNRDAWFTGFTCGLTTSIWVGYPGVDGETPRYMNDAQNVENGLEIPTIAELFGTDEYNNSRGNGDITGGEIPAELWHDFMMEATADGPPCEELPTEGPAGNQQVFGQELLTTLVHCADPDPGLVAAAEAAAAAQTTTTVADQPTPTEQGEETTTTVAPETTVVTEPPDTQPPSSDDGGGNGGDGADESALAPSGSTGAVRTVAYRFAPAQNSEEQPQPTPTPPPTNVPPTTVPVTEPCIPVDLDGQPIESTTLLPGAAPAPAPAPGGGDAGAGQDG
ncbi:MAG: transglycosylase domain-containing protein [Acidimicrobiales bacterium]